MATMNCPGAGCNNGYIQQWVGGMGGVTTRMPCMVCKGTGRVEVRERTKSTNPYACPYNACGGRCMGKGYYDYSGYTIWCSAG